ncbi:PrgI family protein [Frankia sp. AgB1.9]|uniref:PrgI family protein n=1 Tax=unclassified Frankia TaxID=2632575 RepID=UPI00193448E1|nr:MULTISPECIES: PrgI family protein [unclassified Frankia]MBL7487799.1 PrgI family protein [Frankia sp. AgW1.1]MBL7553196.1 PrgI family protein [Frankia sp. AgB1.9]MBL7622959.1 PrgI family protein [Frankia sp. AgB1.8]
MTNPVRIPADVDREDRLLGSLTARQVLFLALTGIGLYLAFTATRAVLPLPLFALGAVPVAAGVGMLVLGQRDGLSLDRLLLAAIRQHTSPRRRIHAPEGVVTPPPWLAARATSTDRRRADGQAGAPIGLPARTVTPTAGVGVIDLGADGLAVVAAASTVNFGLATPDEQDGLVAVFARWLHSLTAPVQILVRTVPVDLSAQIADLDEAADQLDPPALARAAREHAAFLAALGDQMQLLTHQVLLVLREPLIAAGPVDGLGGASPLTAVRGRRTAGRDARRAGDATRRAAHTRLARRLSEAVTLLAPAGIVVTPLDADAATSVLADACNPARLVPASALANPDQIITAYRHTPDHDEPAAGHASTSEEAGLDDAGWPDDDPDAEDPSADDPWEPPASGWVPEIPADPPLPRRPPAARQSRTDRGRGPR